MKIYTRQGDDGTTGLFGGQRISKADGRLECYGTIDELNAALGLAAAGSTAVQNPTGDADALVRRLQAVQNDLFVIGSLLATPRTSAGWQKLPQLGESAVGRLEQEIDAAEAELPALGNFILPGGAEMAARLHMARTICRRAERLLVSLVGQADVREEIPPEVLPYLNRLGDWLFVQARWINRKLGETDILWKR